MEGKKPAKSWKDINMEHRGRSLLNYIARGKNLKTQQLYPLFFSVSLQIATTNLQKILKIHLLALRKQCLVLLVTRVENSLVTEVLFCLQRKHEYRWWSFRRLVSGNLRRTGRLNI